MQFGVKIWWITLSVIAVMNIIVWVYSVIWFFRSKKSFSSDVYAGRVLILWLSGGYVLGCAFRSLLPRIDLERIVLVNTWLSSMLVGRTVATVAELCFIAQCAILLHEVGKETKNKLAITVSVVLLPMIMVAEGFSWYAVTTTHYLGSVVEESLWTIAGILLVVSFVSIWPQVKDNQRHFITTMILFGVGFLVFMFTVDVPMYVSRWISDIASGQEYLSFRPGIFDATIRYTVNFNWNIWREEIPWMTLYFTIAVWVSIYLAYAPKFEVNKVRNS